MQRLYDKYRWKSEKKAADATSSQKNEFCGAAAELLFKYPGIKVDCITVKKTNVQPHIRQDANKLYNYMVSLIVPEYVSNQPSFELIPDARSIKVRSQNSLADYLQIKLWFDLNRQTTVFYKPTISEFDYALQFVDWISHCVWMRYEDADSTHYNVLKPSIRIRPLFFGEWGHGE